MESWSSTPNVITFVLTGPEWWNVIVALGDTMERRDVQYKTGMVDWSDDGVYSIKISDPKTIAAINAIIA